MKWICLVLIFFTFQAKAQQHPTVLRVQSSQQREVTIPEGFSKETDVVYKQSGDWEGKMDIYLPPRGELSTPVIFVIHGGAWRHGSKEQMGGFNTFFNMGFAVVNVSYRLSDAGKAPAAIEDIRCAIAFIVNRSAELNIDTERVVISGSSAGGHLALMAGLTGSIPLFENGCTPSVGFQIAAIIARYAPVMLWEIDDDGSVRVLHDSAVSEWFGERSNDLFFARAVSPISYVSKTSPPVFLVHGDADPRVSYSQSVLLDNRLTALDVPHRFITVKGGGHGGFSQEQQAMVDDATVSFLKKHLFLKE